MISKKMQKKLNDQLKEEYYSSYLYLAMSAYCSGQALEGCAKWMRIQSEEEMEHAMKIMDYLQEQQADVVLAALPQPPAGYRSALDVFEKALGHERHITKCIHDLMSAAVEEKDYATQEFLQWYVKEQVEEESAAQGVVDHLKMVGDSKNGLLNIDRQLGKRGKD